MCVAGSLPVSWVNLLNLQVMNLAGNNLSGTIPELGWNHTDSSTRAAELSATQINFVSSGSINITATFPELLYMDLSSNRLTGKTLSGALTDDQCALLSSCTCKHTVHHG